MQQHHHPPRPYRTRITKIVAVNYVSGQSIELQVCLIRNENLYHANNRARSYVINQSWKERFVFQILVMFLREKEWHKRQYMISFNS